MANDPGRLAVHLRNLADAAAPYRGALTEAARATQAPAAAAADRAAQARSLADAAQGTAEDQLRAVAEVRGRAQDLAQHRGEVAERARHAVEYAEQCVAVVDRLRQQWEGELATAEALVTELLNRIEMGGRAGEAAQRRLPAALERRQCCATAVQRCREAAGTANVGLQRAREAAGCAAEFDATLTRAEEFVERAGLAADEASSRAWQAREAAAAAEDAGERVRALAGTAQQHAEAGAAGLTSVAEQSAASAAILEQVDRGGLP